MTNDKREQLRMQLAEHSGEVIEAFIDALAFAGAQPDWDSGTIEGVLGELEEVTRPLGIPGVGNTGDEDEALKFWCEVGGYDYEGDHPDEEEGPPLFTIETKFVHMKDALVSRAKYHDGSLAVVAEGDDEDGMGTRETLSTNLSAYGFVPGPNQFFVKDYSEHEGLAVALAMRGIATLVDPAPYTFGPHDAKAYLMQLSEVIR